MPRQDDTASTGRRASEKKRKVKMADLRTLIETRMFSKSDRTLERVGLDPVAPEHKPLERTVGVFLISIQNSKKSEFFMFLYKI